MTLRLILPVKTTFAYWLLWAILINQAQCCSSPVSRKNVIMSAEQGYAYPELLISTETLNNDLNENTQLTIIDVRPNGDFRKGHIPGAINLQWTHCTYPSGSKAWQLLPLWIVQLRLGLAGISRGDKIVIYGDQETGWGEDGRFFWMFSYFGHDNFRILNGGWNQWNLEGRSTTNKNKFNFPTWYRAEVRPELLADKNWVKENYKKSGIAVIDARSPEEYKGAVLYGEPRGGHIPGAKSLPWKETIGSDYKIKPAEELQRMLSSIGVEPGQETAVYCTGGVRSGHLYFVLKLLGYQKVRNYDGSFQEWAADPELPVE